MRLPPKWLLLALTLSLTAPTTAHAYVPERTPHREASAAATTVLAQREVRPTSPGLVIMRGGRALVSVNGDRAMTPASLLKLLTTTAAMTRFGPDHRFATRALAARRGATVSTLYLVGGGDPTFSTEEYRRARFLPKPTDVIKRPAFPQGSPTVEQLAARIAASGVRRITGGIVGDQSLFDDVRTQPGWLDRYLVDEPDTGLLTPLSLNEGLGDIRGKTLLPNPALAATTALAAALRARGVEVAGAIRLGRAPARSAEIARVESPKTRDIIDFINRYSINFPAEVLLKSMGAAFGGAGTTAAGVRVVRDTLTELRVPLGGLRMEDGSGLSLLDRVRPTTIAAVLERILTGTQPGFDALRASIPVAGEPGTLQTRMRTGATAGNLRGKTGQVSKVRAMAGWVRASDGIPLIYVAIFNNADSPFSLTRPLDLLGALLAGYPY